MQEWIDQAVAWSGLSEQTLRRIAETLVILLIIFLIRMVSMRVVRRRVDDIKRSYHIRRVVNYVAGFLAVLLIARVWLTGLQDFATFLGLLSAGLAVALSDLLANLAGWMFILARRPYTVGDRISIDQHTGDVIDIRLFQTMLLECGEWVDADQSTGRIIMVPNGMVFKATVANYTHGFEHVWDELGVLVTFESDWKKAKELLREIATTHAESLSTGVQEQIRRAASKHMIFFRNLTPIVYTSVKDSGVMLSMRYLTHPRQRRGSQERMWEAILEAFAKESSIDFAYPTTRYYLNHIEGKPEARAPYPVQSPTGRVETGSAT